MISRLVGSNTIRSNLSISPPTGPNFFECGVLCLRQVFHDSRHIPNKFFRIPRLEHQINNEEPTLIGISRFFGLMDNNDGLSTPARTTELPNRKIFISRSFPCGNIGHDMYLAHGDTLLFGSVSGTRHALGVVAVMMFLSTVITFFALFPVDRLSQGNDMVLADSSCSYIVDLRRSWRTLVWIGEVGGRPSFRNLHNLFAHPGCVAEYTTVAGSLLNDIPHTDLDWW